MRLVIFCFACAGGLLYLQQYVDFSRAFGLG
jgi:hypothetical protein